MHQHPTAGTCPPESDGAHTSRWRRRLRIVAMIATVSTLSFTAVAAGAGSASASLLGSCRARPTSTPFAPWGDDSSYFGMRGASFESGGTGWTLNGATVVSDNESYFVNSPTDTQSLSLPDGAEAISPRTCVAMGEDSVRFFVESSGDATSTLHVEADVRDPSTGLVLSAAYDISSGAGAGVWAPTDPLLIPNLLGGVLGTQQLTLTFTTSGTPATWNIDDIYVDPFKSH